jgi:hypothetical protein
MHSRHASAQAFSCRTVRKSVRAARRFRAKAILPDGQTPGEVRTINATPLAEHEVAALLRGTVGAPAAARWIP